MARAKAACEERRRRWTELVTKWQGSGSSQAVFCREHGLNANTFNFWKLRVLRQRPGTRHNRRMLEATADDDSKFIPVRVATQSSCAFEVCLRSGHTIRIAPGFDETSLRRLINLLEPDGGADRAC